MVKLLDSVMNKWLREHKLLTLVLIIFLVNLTLKWYKIDSIPAGATYDEIIYAAEAQHILEYGTNLAGNWRPWYFAPSDGMYTELTSTTLVPGLLLFPNQPVLAHKIVPVILGSLVPVLMALIAFYFFKKKEYLLTVGLAATLNPWIFQFSRTAFDSLFSVFFYLLGITLMLHLKGYKKLLAFLPFFWGFMQYQGHKPILLPLATVVFLAIFLNHYFNDVRIINTQSVVQKFLTSLKANVPSLIIVLLAALLSAAYMYRLNSITAVVRSNEITIVGQDVIERTVDEKRRLSFDSPLNQVFSNKVTAYSEIIVERLLKSFNPERLFLSGNARIDTFSVVDHGFFHWVDIFVIFSFFAFVATQSAKYRVGALFIIGITLAGTVTNVIRNGEVWITFRGAFSFLGLVLMIGVALGYVLKKLGMKYGLLVLAVYTILTAPLFYIYFYRYPITQTVHPGFSERVLANYVLRESDRPFILVTDRTDSTFDYIQTYNQLVKVDSQEAMNQAAKSRDRLIDNGRIRIIESCPKEWGDIRDDTIVAIDFFNLPCDTPEFNGSVVEIKSLVDSGTRFRIFNDRFCSGLDLPEYSNLKENRLSVEKLSDVQFCQTFFTK